MTNKDKYDQVFMECFSVDKDILVKGLAYSEIDQWDSIGHMQMVATLEDTFKITLDTDDIIDFSSYKKGFELLSKYGVAFDS